MNMLIQILGGLAALGQLIQGLRGGAGGWRCANCGAQNGPADDPCPTCNEARPAPAPGGGQAQALPNRYGYLACGCGCLAILTICGCCALLVLVMLILGNTGGGAVAPRGPAPIAPAPGAPAPTMAPAPTPVPLPTGKYQIDSQAANLSGEFAGTIQIKELETTSDGTVRLTVVVSVSKCGNFWPGVVSVKVNGRFYNGRWNIAGPCQPGMFNGQIDFRAPVAKGTEITLVTQLGQEASGVIK